MDGVSQWVDPVIFQKGAKPAGLGPEGTFPSVVQDARGNAAVGGPMKVKCVIGEYIFKVSLYKVRIYLVGAVLLC